MKALLQYLFFIVFLSAATAHAAPQIEVQGRDSTFGVWSDIDDEDLDPDQVVTEFGNVDLGTTSTRTFRIRNTGNETLTISSFTSSNSRYTIDGLINGSVAAANGGVNEFTVTFTPNALSTVQTVITLRSNDPGDEDPYTFALGGTGQGPDISIGGGTTGTTFASIVDGTLTTSSTAGTNFGSIVAGSSRTRFFRISNHGTTALNIQVPDFTGSGESNFTFNGLSSAVNIAAGNTRDFEIVFQPTLAGVKNAVFTISSNDFNESPYTFAVTGTATGEPDIVVEGNDAISWPNIADGDLTAGQVVTRFGNVAMGSSDTRFYRIRNTGVDVLNVTAATSSSLQFAFEGLPLPLDLAPGAEEVFTVRFTPTAFGDTTTVLTFTNDDPDLESTYTFAVTGNGQGAEIGLGGATTAAGPFITILDGDNTPATNDGTAFGTTAIGNVVTRYFRITNGGSSALNLQSPTFTGSGAGHFSTQGLSSAINLAAGNTRDFEIRFDPTTVGSKTAVFSLGSNDLDEDPFTFTISGSATGTPSVAVEGSDGVGWPDIDDGDLDPDQAVTDFGNVELGQMRERRYRVRNVGTATLNISAVTSSNARYAIAGIGAGSSIAAGAEREFTVTFTPTVRSTVQTVITLSSNAAGGLANFTFALTGTGRGAEIALEGSTGDQNGPWVNIMHNDLTPSTSDGTEFGIVGNHTFATRYFRIRNVGDSSLSIFQPAFVGADPTNFTIHSLQSLTNIPPGNDRTFEIRFSPSNIVTQSATFGMTNGDADESPFTFGVRGTGRNEPDIHLQLDTSPVSGVPVWSDVAEGDAIGNFRDDQLSDNVNVGYTGDRRFRFRNTGPTPLTISTITFSDPQFFIDVLTLPVVIPPGQIQAFSIDYAPDRFGDTVADVTITSDDPDAEGTFVFQVKGTGIGPEPRLSGQGDDSMFRVIPLDRTTVSTTDGTDFGQVPLTGSSITHTFRIANLGNRNLEINGRELTGAAAGDFNVNGLLPSGFNRIINEGESHDFTVVFDPSATGTRRATLQINYWDGVTTQSFTFALRGSGFGTPEIEVRGQSGALDPFTEITNNDISPRTTDGTAYGSISVSGEEVHTFKIKNLGDVPLAISDIVENSPHFSLGAIPTSIPANAEATFNLGFYPTSAGNHSAVISIENGDADEADFRFTVSGTGLAPELDVLGGGDDVAIADGDTTPSLEDGTDFGTINAGGGSVNRTFILRNTGTRPLSIFSVAFSNPIFSAVSFPTSIPAGGSGSLVVNAQVGGTASATVTLENNDPDEDPYTFRVRVSSGVPVQEIQVSGLGAVIFSDGQTALSTTDGTIMREVQVGGTRATSFTISNVGTGPLTVSSVTSSNPLFTITEVPTALAAGTGETFKVRFTPTSSGQHHTIITITSNDADESPFTFALRGVATAAPPAPAPELEVTGGATPLVISSGDTTPRQADGTHFGAVQFGLPLTSRFLLRNTGSVPLSLASASVSSGSPFTLSTLIPSITSGGSTSVTVTFTPTVIGEASATLTILSNAENAPIFSITIAAEAVAPPGELAITGIEPVGNKMRLSFTSVPGRTYRIRRSFDLVTWQAVTDMTALPGDLTPQTYTVPQGPDGRRFWRVEQE